MNTNSLLHLLSFFLLVVSALCFSNDRWDVATYFVGMAAYFKICAKD